MLEADDETQATGCKNRQADKKQEMLVPFKVGGRQRERVHSSEHRRKQTKSRGHPRGSKCFVLHLDRHKGIYFEDEFRNGLRMKQNGRNETPSV